MLRTHGTLLFFFLLLTAFQRRPLLMLTWVLHFGFRLGVIRHTLRAYGSFASDCCRVDAARKRSPSFRSKIPSYEVVTCPLVAGLVRRFYRPRKTKVLQKRKIWPPHQPQRPLVPLVRPKSHPFPCGSGFTSHWDRPKEVVYKLLIYHSESATFDSYASKSDRE